MDGINFTTDDLEDCAADRAMLEEMMKDAATNTITCHREPGWVDRYQLAEALGTGIDSIKKMLKEMVENGKWKTIKVYDPDRGAIIRVYRKRTER